MNPKKKYLPALMVLFAAAGMLLFSCKAKNLPANEIYAFLKKANPYAQDNVNRADTYGYGDVEAAIKDSIALCYEMLNEEDRKLRPIIADLAKNHPSNEDILFISGKNHMNLENYAKCLEIFSSLRSAENFEIRDQSRYYFALVSVYLDGEDQKAIALLKEISEDDKSKFSDLAEDLLYFL